MPEDLTTLLESLKRQVSELTDQLASLQFSFWKKTGPSPSGISNTDLESTNFVTGSTGWRLDADGNLEANNGNFRGDVTGASGTFSGTLTGGSLNIPDTTTANSMHVDSSGNTWWGANVASGFSSAVAKVLNTGAATFTSLTVTGYNTAFIQVPLSKTYIAGGSIAANDAVYGGYSQTDGGIVFDAGVSNQQGTTPFTWSHVCTGSNRFLVVELVYLEATAMVTAVTYNGVSMTQLGTRQNVTGSQYHEVWYLIAPASGSNTISVTYSGTTTGNMAGSSASWVGVKQTGFPDASRTFTGSAAATGTQTITTVAQGANVIMTTCWNTGGGANALSGVTSRAIPSNSGMIGDSTTTAATLPGNVSQSFNFTGGSGAFAGRQFSIAPAVVPVSSVLSTSASNASTSNTFLGFALASATIGNSVTVFLSGEVAGFTGLLLGSQYYLSNSTGLIAATAGSVTRKVGIATSTTTLLISNIW